MKAEAESKGLKRNQLRKFVKGPSTEAADRPDVQYHDAAMTDIAIGKLKEKRGKPFFMTVGYKKPHLPFVAPKRYWDLYDRAEIHLPNNYYFPKRAPKIAGMTWGELRAFNDIPNSGPVSDEKALELIHGYRACVSFADAQVGRLLEAVDSEGLAKNTIVIVWSDHGWKLGEHSLWCKHTNFQIDARVPLIIRMPGAAAGQTTSAMVELIDLYPTLCNAVGIDVPAVCEGRNLLPLIANPKADWASAAYSQYKRGRKTGGDIIGYSMKVPEGRYTEWTNVQTKKVVATEYYDHTSDPDENQNVAQAISVAEKSRLSATLGKQHTAQATRSR